MQIEKAIRILEEIRGYAKEGLYTDALSAGIAALREIGKSRWIPVSERLPEKDTPVIIYAAGHRATAYYDEAKGAFRLMESDDLFYWTGAVTHWAPLPEPPETKEN